MDPNDEVKPSDSTSPLPAIRSNVGQKGESVGKWLRTKFRRNRRATEVGAVAFCPHCGAVNAADFQSGDTCPACQQIVSVLSSNPPSGPSLAIESGQSANADNVSALQSAILEWVNRGYVVVRQRNDLAEMRKPKRLSAKWTAAWVIAGIPLPGSPLIFGGGYALWHAVKKSVWSS